MLGSDVSLQVLSISERVCGLARKNNLARQVRFTRTRLAGLWLIHEYKRQRLSLRTLSQHMFTMCDWKLVPRMWIPQT